MAFLPIIFRNVMNMSHKHRDTVLYVLPLLLFAVLAIPAYAQEGAATTPPQTATKHDDLRTKLQKTRSNIQNNRTEQKQNLGERMDTHIEKAGERASTTIGRIENRKAKVATAVQERIRAHAARMFARFNAAVERHEKLSERIDSRIKKIEAEGHPNAEPRRLLEEARGFIQEGKALLGQAKTAFENALQSEKPKEAFAAAHETLKQAEEKIKSAHASLMKTVRELRSAMSNTGQ